MERNFNTQPSTLISAAWPQSGLWREIILIFAGSIVIALSARLSINIGPVPITGQTFGVLLVAAVLGRRGTLSVLLYIFQGIIGLPVFAGGAAGPAVLLGPTAGYIMGFIPASYVVGYLCEQGWDRHFLTAAAAMLIGNLIIYGFGITWLATFVGWDRVLTLGLLPFIPGDLIKIGLAAAILPTAWKLLAFRL